MKHIHSIALLFIGLVLPNLLFSQSQLSGGPAAPSAAANAFGKYAAAQINLSNGTAAVGVPLYTVSDGTISLPISLSYLSTGCRVSELASNVGMGWTLNAGGMIGRTIMGQPDDSDYGIYYNSPTWQGKTMQEIHSYGYDTEPDMFYYNVAGLTGKFTISDFYGTKLIPKNNIDIDPVWNSDGLVGFVLRSPDGTRYHFGLDPVTNEEFTEKTYRDDPDFTGEHYRTGWFLTRVESADQKHKIVLDYHPSAYKFQTLASKLDFTVTAPAGYTMEDIEDPLAQTHPLYSNIEWVPMRSEGHVIKSITGSSNSVNFNVSPRSDLEDFSSTRSPLRIDEIISNDGHNCTKYILYYDHFQSNIKDPTLSYQKRLKLTSLEHISCDINLKEPRYYFEYDGPMSTSDPNKQFYPFSTSKAFDHWGYYNGHDGTEQVNNNLVSNLLPMGMGNGYGIADRNPDFTYGSIGMLKKITYPTGGYQEFIYEANETEGYSVDPMWQPLFIPLNHCSQPNNCCDGASVVTKSFNLNQSKINTGFIEIFVDEGMPDPFGQNCRVLPNANVNLELKLNGNIVYSANFNILNYLQKVRFDLAALNISPGAYDMSVSTDYGELHVKGQYYQTNALTETGGTRIQSVKIHDGIDAAKDMIKRYVYEKSSLSGLISSGKLYRLPVYQVNSTAVKGDGNVVLTYNVKSSTPIHPLAAFDGHHVKYSRVEERYRYQNNDTGGGKKVYYFEEEYHNPDFQTFPTVPEKVKLISGNPHDVKTYDAQGDLIADNKVTRYVSDEYEEIPQQSLSWYALECDNMGTSFYAYTKKEYTQRTGIYRAGKVESYIDGVLVSTEEHTYPNHDRVLKPSSTTTTKSTGEVYKTNFFYTDDYTLSTTIDGWFDNFHILDAVWKTTDSVKHADINGLEQYQMIGGSMNQYIMYLGNPYVYDSYQYETKQDPNTNAWSGLWNLVAYRTYNLQGLLYQLNKRTNGFSPIVHLYNSKKQIKSIEYLSVKKTFDYYTNSTALSSITEADGTTTSYLYDKLGRPSQITENCSAIVTDITYDFADNTTPYNKKTITTTYPQVDNSGIHIFSDVTYSDGIGRTLQTVAVGRSPQGKDIVSAIERDELGRTVKSYQPYESAFSDGRYIAIPSTHPHGTVNFASSPMSRKLLSLAPDWYPTTMSYGTNTANEVKNPNVYGLPSYHAAGTLIKTITTDGNGIESHVFKNDRGKTILTRRIDPDGAQNSETYFVYDQKNQLTHVLPTGTDFTDTEKIFTYKYTERGQITRKKVPGAEEIYYRFDERGLLGYMQDGLLRSQNRWYTYRYDGYNRERWSGFKNGGGNANYNFTIAAIDEMQTIQTYGGTSLSASPLWLVESKSKVLGSSNDWIVTTPQYNDLCGRSTGSEGNSLMNLTPASNNTTVVQDWMNNVTLSSHTFMDGSETHTTEQKYIYDHAGRQTETYHRLSSAAFDLGPDFIQIGANVYDHKNQLTTQYLGGGASQYLQKVDFDYRENGILNAINGNSQGNVALENGDLFSMRLLYDQQANLPYNTPQYNGNISAVEWKAAKDQNIKIYSYRYDFKNQLKEAKYAEYVNGFFGNQNRYTTNITYDELGNVQTLKRNGAYIDGGQLQYGQIDDISYNYQAGSHLLESVTENASNLVAKQEGLKRSNISNNIYDDNGNMTYDGVRDVHISYNHLNLPTEIIFPDGKKIKWVYEAGGGVLRKTQHLADGTEVDRRDYIGDIEYRNGRLECAYHAYGRVVNKSNLQLNISGVLDKSRVYDAQAIQSNALLTSGVDISYFAQDSICLREGFEVPTGGQFLADIKSVKYDYEYHLKDHLGNTRVVFSDIDRNHSININKEVLQTTAYYPFGMRHNLSRQIRYEKRGYNSMEHVDDFGLDITHTTYRTLDPALGRWMQLDPKSEATFGLTPFCSMNNNPISQVDPEGDLAWFLVPVIGAAVGVFSNGVSNLIAGRNFFQGAGKAALWGAASAVVSAGIGSAFGEIGKIGKEIGRAFFHGMAQGVMAEAQGGNFFHGFASGALASLAGSGVGALDGTAFDQIMVGGLAGAAGSAIAGGNPIHGWATGVAVGLFNHALHSALSGSGPPWEYNGKKYKSKSELYLAILVDKAAEQFGIKDLVALAVALDGTFPTIDKRFSTPGASKKTSYASKYGSKLLPQKIPKRLPTHINMKTGKVAFTKVLGRFVGRLAGPVGWGLLTYDVGMTIFNTQRAYNSIIND